MYSNSTIAYSSHNAPIEAKIFNEFTYDEELNLEQLRKITNQKDQVRDLHLEVGRLFDTLFDMYKKDAGMRDRVTDAEDKLNEVLENLSKRIDDIKEQFFEQVSAHKAADERTNQQVEGYRESISSAPKFGGER